MAKKATIYHNPRCSKSRQTLGRLEEAGCEVKVVRYLEEPPTARELGKILSELDLEPVDIIRRKEKRFRELGLSVKDERSRKEWLEILAREPSLIERPIVRIGGRAVLGRPPENVDELL